MEYAIYILKSTAIFTATEKEPRSGAVAVAGNKILAVGTVEEIEQYRNNDTKVRDYGDRLLMPGFNDSHMHFPLGSVQNDPDFCIPMLGIPSEEGCVEATKQFAETHPDNPWIYGWGWYMDVWENPHMPSRASLDALHIDRPICLVSFDLHTVWCNGVALEKMGITRDTPQPEGGHIVMNADGEPDGILQELPANKPMMDEALNVPDLKSSLMKSLATFRTMGITSIGDAYPAGVTNNNVLEIYHDMEESGELTCRMHVFHNLEEVDTAKKLRQQYHSDFLCISGVKQMLDGIVEANTAYVKEPYANLPDSCGIPRMKQEHLNELVLEASEAGFACKLHTIGNRAAQMALDAYELALNTYGDKGLHHAIEHIEAIDTDEIARMAQLNVLGNVQPIHSAAGLDAGGYHVCLGEKRASFLWPFRELLDVGVKLAFGTDYPAAFSVAPLLGIYSAVTRCVPEALGDPTKPHYPEHAVTLAEALIAYTRTAAYAESAEDKLGTLEPGKLADIVVIDRNLFTTEPIEIQHAKVDMTMVDGKIVFEAEH